MIKKDKIIEESASVSVNPITANSTRPECVMQISILHTIFLFTQTHKVHSIKLHIYIDNISSFITIKTTTPQWSFHISHKWLRSQNNNT